MNKFVSFVVTSISLLTLLAGPGHSSSDNNNNESTAEYNGRLALQHIPLVRSETVALDSLPIVPATSTGIISHPLVPQRAENAPSVLSLRSSLQLQSACRLFMAPTAATEMNNVCTNLAYEQALKLYAQHGDRFIGPFSEHIHGLFFGLLESSVKKAIGVGDLFNAIKKLTGFKVTGQQYLTEAANRNLPQSVLNALRLKFATDLLNKHVVGPQVVAPNIAYAVNKMNLGQILQEQLFVRFCSILVSFQDELVDRSVLELKEYAEQIATLNEELSRARASLLPAISEDEKRLDASKVSTLKAEIEKLNTEAKAELSWIDTINPMRNNTQKELGVSKNCQTLADLEKEIKEKHQIRQEQLDKIKKLESKIESLKSEGQATAQALIAAGRYNNQGQVTEHDFIQANLLRQPTYTLRELFGDLPYIGASIDRYMSPCPHFEPGYLSSLMTGENLSLVASIPKFYLRLTGVMGSVERLREDLSLQAFTRTFDETVTKINNVRNAPTRIAEVQFMPTEEQLEGKSSVIAGLKTIKTVARGTGQALHHVSEARTEAKTIHMPALDHLRRIQTHAQRGIVNLNIATAPARVAYNFLVNTGQIWAVNYLSNLVRGTPATDHVYLIAFTLAILQQFYILLSHMM